MASRPPPLPPGRDKPGASPIPVPRKRAPPPKPAPYKQHKEHRANEITTFKSNLPIQPQMRSHPPVPAERKLNRVSLKGEPSTEFFQPKHHTQAPVQYGIPVVPKAVLDQRPRLDTPAIPPDPDVISKKSPTSNSTPSTCIESRPRLDTPLVPPDPAVILPSSSLTVEGSSQQQRNSLAGGVLEYATIDEDDVMDEEESSYAVVDKGKRASIDNSTTPVLSLSSIAPPTPIVSGGTPTPSPPPLPERNYEDDEFITSSPTHIQPLPSLPPTQPLPSSPSPSPLSAVSSQDDEYSSTSHAKLKSRPISRVSPDPTPPPQAPPTASDAPAYNVTSHGAPPPAVKPLKNSSLASSLVDDMNGNETTQEYSHLSILSPCLGMDDEYSHLTIPGPEANSKQVQELEYEEVIMDPPRQVRTGPNPPRKPSRLQNGSPMAHKLKKGDGESCSVEEVASHDHGAGIKPKPAVKPKSSPKVKSYNPPSTSTKSPATHPKPHITPPTVSATKLPAKSSSASPPNPSPKPKPPAPPKSKPVPLSIQMKLHLEDETMAADADSGKIPSPLSQDSKPPMKISPKVELDIDSLVSSAKMMSYENQAAIPVDTQALGGAAYMAPLSPSEIFTVPQHAVPGHLNYCEMDIDSVAQPAVLGSSESGGGGGKVSGEVVVVPTRSHLDSRGYCDINVRGVGSEENQSKVPAPSSGAQDFPVEAKHNFPNNQDLDHSYAEVPRSASPVPNSDSHGQSGTGNYPSSLNLPTMLPQKIPKVPSAQRPPKPPRPTSNECHSRTPSYDATPGSEGLQEPPSGDGGRSFLETSGGPESTATNPPDAIITETAAPNTKAASQKGVGRRRTPPPPPPAGVGISPTCPKDFDSSRNAVSKGLCTLPRSKPPNARKRRPEEVKNGSQGSKQFPPLPLEPFSSEPPRPQNQTVPRAEAAAATTTSSTSSPGLKKKFIGFLKKPNIEFRQSSRRKKKQKEKEDLTQSLAISPSTKSLPRNMHAKQWSLDAEEDESEEFGIYSTISETTGTSSIPKAVDSSADEEEEEEKVRY